MKPRDIIEALHHAGVTVVTINDGSFIKLTPGRLVTPDLATMVRAYKLELLEELRQQTMGEDENQKAAPVEPLLKLCCICGGVDFIHGHKGGFFCCECQPDAHPGERVKAGGRIATRAGNDSNDGNTPKGLAKKDTIPANAVEWLRKHRAELKAAGWKPAEIYRRNRSRGIAWLFLWGKRDVQVTMQHDGSIAFSFTDTLGRVIRQVARPKARSHSQDGR